MWSLWSNFDPLLEGGRQRRLPLQFLWAFKKGILPTPIGLATTSILYLGFSVFSLYDLMREKYIYVPLGSHMLICDNFGCGRLRCCTALWS